MNDNVVPAELAGPGTIEVQQTTYLDVRAEAGARYRIHFPMSIERSVPRDVYPSLELPERHPLLVRYEEPVVSLYYYGAPADPHELAMTLNRELRAQSESWRGLVDYAGHVEPVERSLSRRYGS
jgi:hypothetical protein